MKKIESKAIYLGSKSSARLQILRENGYEVVPISVDISEEPREEDKDKFSQFSPAEKVLYITNMKTDAILSTFNHLDAADLLVCGDILVTTKSNQPIGKPIDRNHVRELLELYNRDKTLGTVQALEVVDLKNQKRVSGTDTVHIYLKEDNLLPTEGEEFEEYASQTMGSAGALLIEHPFMKKRLAKLDGDEDSVKGFSMSLFKKLTKQL